MDLAPGLTLSHYRIVAKIGEGGMGMVYRALDLRLEREVAVKVLPSGVLADEGSRTRFRQEALVLSRLNHPHIAVVHDFDSENGVDFLVMELLEGETLAARVGRGEIPLDQMLRHAIEIAEALDKAHRHGIIHRDLKPGNVMLTPNGAKLLDFGLAKLKGAEAGGSGAGLSTLATGARSLTAEGSIVGTFQYMAPEQLEGKPADARTDIFALGAVLYEMSTGRKAFEGKSQASLIAAIMGGTPPSISQVRPMTPLALDRLVKTCFAKEPDERWQTAHDVKLQLQWIAEGGSQAGLPAPVLARRRGRERWAWALAAVLAALTGVLAAGRWIRAVPEVRAIRSSVLPPEGRSFELVRGKSGALSMSPDGRHLTFALRGGEGDDLLWIRSLDSLSARPLPGTKGATWPFWSPDSRFIGFFADGKLKKIDLVGSPALSICDATDGRSGAWNAKGEILFAPTTVSPIHRVAAAGGQPAPVTKIDEDHGETTHRWVTFLPDGRHFLYLAGSHSSGTKSEANAVYAGQLGSDQRKLVLRVRSNVAYASGHLLYVRDRVLLAQPFDPGRLELSGDPVPISEGIDYDTGFFRAVFSASSGPMLAYQAGGADSSAQLTWFDRDGKALGKVGEPGEFADIALSPDGKRVAFALTDRDSGTADIWIQDLARGVRTRLTFGAANEYQPVWSPDGQRIAYSISGKFDDLFVRPSSGGKEELLLHSDQDKRATGWSADGRLLVYDVNDPTLKTTWDIRVLPLLGGGEPRPFLESEFTETSGKLSPDGRYMLYDSDESGKAEVYVAPFPGAGGKWQISTQGGSSGSWTRGGAEIIYLAQDLTLMAVSVRAQGSSFEADTPRPLYKIGTSVGDITADGERALLAVRPEAARNLPITLVTNWPAGLSPGQSR